MRPFDQVLIMSGQVRENQDRKRFIRNFINQLEGCEMADAEVQNIRSSLAEYSRILIEIALSKSEGTKSDSDLRI